MLGRERAPAVPGHAGQDDWERRIEPDDGAVPQHEGARGWIDERAAPRRDDRAAGVEQANQFLALDGAKVRLALLAEDGRDVPPLSRFDARTGELRWQRTFPDKPNVWFAPDGDHVLLMSMYNDGVEIWDGATQTQTGTLELPERGSAWWLLGHNWSPDESMIAGTVHITGATHCRSKIRPRKRTTAEIPAPHRWPFRSIIRVAMLLTYPRTRTTSRHTSSPHATLVTCST